MSQNGKLMPNLDQQSTKLLNLTVLQRFDPFIEEILITAAHVTFYEFNIDLSQWSRRDVEGSLFVVKRNTQPRFQFVVMNRRNTDNLVENLLGDFEFEVQVLYLLYRNASQEVNGIWFYNARECEEECGLRWCGKKSLYCISLWEQQVQKYGDLVSHLSGKMPQVSFFLQDCKVWLQLLVSDSSFPNWVGRILNAYSKVPQKSKVATSKSEFEELEAVPTMAVMDGPLESTPSNAADVPEDPAFVNYFSTALTVGNTSNAAISAQPYQSNTTISLPSHPASVASPIVPTLQIPSPPLSAPTPNLVKPSLFFVPPPSSYAQMMQLVSSSTPTAPPLNPPLSLQRPYGAPMLQPFPLPTPPPSLTPALTSNSGPFINKEKV
ncbi:hypothetical protein WN944_027522 [Citrus x changshan-huyou]|uniref:mRNA-decapping enzyme-like protein n=1 Tax=Citrus x changshan-huyou TaxID=2935761 RepID=A0AAP0LIN6_9ROSI